MSSASYLLTDHLISSEGTTCLQIMEKLSKQGVRFTAIGGYVDVKKPPENVRLINACSVKVSPYDKIPKKYYSHMEFILKSYLKASKLLQKEKIDIVHHMFPAVYGQTFSLLAIKDKVSKPFIFGPTSAHFTVRPLDERIIGKVTFKLHLKTVSKCNCLIAITEQVKQLYSQIFDEDKIIVIPLGVDMNIFKPKKSGNSKSKKDFTLLFVGSLYPLKGVEYLIKSLKHIVREEKNVKLRIVGDGPEKERLKRLASRLRVSSKISFEGFVPHDEIVEYYQNCDVFCFPSLGEPFGLAILEAMACGKPVIASNRGGSTEIVENRKTGFLVNPTDVSSVAEKIVELMRNRKLREKMGCEARRAVLEEYSLDVVSNRLLRLYSRLI